VNRIAPPLAILPMALLLLVVATPLLFLLVHISANSIGTDWSSFEQTMKFAAGGAAIATIVGGALGILFGTREFPGRRWLLMAAIVSIASPPAFWWIGMAHITSGLGNASGVAAASFVAGLALAPVTLLLVLASLQQMPANLYEAARVAFPPIVRIRRVLLPLVRPALTGSFVLTLLLLLGESELPFLFGFRTLMTDVVTTFSQTFDVGRTLPLVIPLLLTVLVMGFIAGKPLMRTLLTSARGSQGVIRRPGSAALSGSAVLPTLYLLGSLAGYASPVLMAVKDGRLNVSLNLATVAVSIAEPVGAAWVALALTLICLYPARRVQFLPYLVWASLLLFCVPAAIYAIGWISAGQMLGGISVPPVVAHTSRSVALCALGFVTGYSRLPSSLENAAQLVRTSVVQRAHIFILPVIGISLIASAALAAALTYADRDVGSLLLPPGASRLTLNLYLASANAPASTIGILAFVVLGGAALTLICAAAGPALFWGKHE